MSEMEIMRAALERIAKAQPDRLDHAIDVCIIERTTRIAREALAAVEPMTDSPAPTESEVK